RYDDLRRRKMTTRSLVKLYRYVGPEHVKGRAACATPGVRVGSARDLLGWLRTSGEGGAVAVTFVVDEQGFLRLADRRYEHVACAGGGPVLSAGELFLRASAAGVRVEEATNQSTGYCPEPESWPAVAAALDRAGIPHPGQFTQEVTFRRCPGCGQRNVV